MGRTDEYTAVLDQTRTGDPSLDRYIRQISAEMRAIDNIDPYEKDTTKPSRAKVDHFLRTHTGMTYEEFVAQCHPETFDTGDFPKYPKTALKRRLFDYRARLYLAALDNCERQGENIPSLLVKIQEGKIPFIKKSRDEPTFSAILRAVRDQ